MLNAAIVLLVGLTGGGVLGFMGSPWPYFLALLFFKTWFNAWYEIRFPRSDRATVLT